MFSSYFAAKRFLALGLGAIILLGIGQVELGWATSYVETKATIAHIEQTCAGGRLARGYINCLRALPTADRRTVLELSYISPADGQRHRAAVRCDTSADDTPRYRIGEELDVLAHESEPERLDRRRCTSVPVPARKNRQA